MVQTRKNSVELVGCDFLVDENLNPWIIEINASPTMEPSTKITERMTK